MSGLEALQLLEERRCPVCGSGKEAAELFLSQSVDPSKLNEFSYASRKVPEFMRFELVACKQCETIYAAAAPPKSAISRAYHEANYDSAEEANLAALTYTEAVAPFIEKLPSKGRALEIGTGTGVFLSNLKKLGFDDVIGIEPSTAAIAAAKPDVRPFIREGIFRGADFQPQSFDLICCFQTLEHVPEPRTLVEECSKLLRQGGLLALVTHDYRSAVNRLLGARSPIIDIEHLQIFCRPSLNRLIRDAGLDVVAINSFWNRYKLSYWLRLSPVPPALKSKLTSCASATGLGNVLLSANVGNLLSIGRKGS